MGDHCPTVVVRLGHNWYDRLYQACKELYPDCELDGARYDDSSSTTCAVTIWECPDTHDDVNDKLREHLGVGGWMEVYEASDWVHLYYTDRSKAFEDAKRMGLGRNCVQHLRGQGQDTVVFTQDGPVRKELVAMIVVRYELAEEHLDHLQHDDDCEGTY
jgi:hypothetical protein